MDALITNSTIWTYIKLLAITLLLTAGAQAQDILYVDADASPGGSGATWADAYRYLQDALIVAGPDTQIRIAEGHYQPDLSDQGYVTAGDMEASFEIGDGIALIGGYAGLGAPDPNAYDPTAYVTVLTGDLAGDDQPDFVNIEENSIHVILFHDGLLQGLTVEGGYAHYQTDEASYHGGGIYCDVLDTATIRDCVFRRCSAAVYGGGVYSLPLAADLRVERCTFDGNRALAGGGGGLHCAEAVLSDCVFRSNTAYSGGGGAATSLGDVLITNCQFIENAVSNGDGGGLFFGGMYGALTMTGCTFTGNTATPRDDDYYGGGGALYATASTVNIISDCTFTENVLGGHGSFADLKRGGAAYCESTVLDRCTFVRNDAFTSGLANGGGLFGNDLMVTDCFFFQNQAAHGGAAFGTGEFVNSVFVDNYAYWGASACGYAFSARNCTFYANSVETYGMLMSIGDGARLTNCVIWGNQPSEISADSDAYVSITYCNVEGGWPGAGNFDADPQFVNPNGPDGDPNTWEDNDYRLAAGSPCINAGWNYEQGLPATDLDGNDRIQQCRIDLGAYESAFAAAVFDDCNGNDIEDDCDVYDATSADCNRNQIPDECDVVSGFSNDVDVNGIPDECDCPGDLDGDRACTLTDLQWLLASYGSAVLQHADGDLDFDGDVDLADLQALLAEYGTTCD